MLNILAKDARAGARRRTRRSMLSSFYILTFQKGTFGAPWRTRFSTEVEGCHPQIEKSTRKKRTHFGGHFGPPGGPNRPILTPFLTPFFDTFLVLPGYFQGSFWRPLILGVSKSVIFGIKNNRELNSKL